MKLPLYGQLPGRKDHSYAVDLFLWRIQLKLSEICVQRPVFAFMLILFLVVLGVFSFVDLGVDLFPRSDPATVFVKVRLPGASPEEVNSQVVMPLEESIALYECGARLKAHCEARLEAARLKVEKIVVGPGGAVERADPAEFT